ncbi:SU10 major capsid protein [Planococcus sp. YIM B11945]|uniref:SU10 major capsid protein n=1 Tax=Planococcus sp. YIM B11945 TaxID=3435410 RepID=UPI003D7CAF5F
MFKVEDKVIDLRDVLVEVNKKQNPFTTFLLSKQVPASAPVYTWIQTEIADSAVTLAEGGDAPQYTKDGNELKQIFLEIFANTATVSNTAQYSSHHGINDLLAKEVDSKTKAIKRRVENKLIHGVGSYDAATGTYHTSGILEQIDTDNKLTGGVFDDNAFEAVVEKLYDAGVSDNMVAFLPASMKKNLVDSANVVHLAREKFMGFDADVYSTVFGQVTFVLTEEIGKGKMFIANPEYIEMPVLIPLHGQVEPVSGSKQSVFLETQLGISLLNEKAAASFEIVEG